MKKNGLSESEQNKNDTEDKDFGSIAKALSEGNQDELDRLMAVKEEDEEDPSKKKPDESPDTDEDDTKDEEEDTSEESKKEKEDEEDKDEESDDDDEPLFEEKKEPEKGKKKEAATPAASPATDKNLEQELHRLRSDAGRVPFMQRRLAELERELRAYKARTPDSSKESKSAPTAEALAKIELDPDTKKEIEDLKEIDPVLARTLERVSKLAIHNANTRTDHVVETFTQSEREAEEQRFYMEQKAELSRMIPRHDEVFSMPEWREWKDTLTPGQRALAESAYANEVAQAIYAFADHMRRREGVTDEDGKTPSTPTPKPKTEVSEARSRKVGSTADVKSSAAKHDEPFDEDKYFREMYNKIGKDSHIL